ncbi:MAG: DDE domain-containing protein [Proteobacteria bacterium]|nr:MAG: DDE domain-containing protein [Pseudomonadota bacterium]
MRDTAAVECFFRKALGQLHTVNPSIITVGRNPAYPRGVAELEATDELWRRPQLRTVKSLNNIVQQNHRRIEGQTKPWLGLGCFWTPRRTLTGYEVMAMVRRGQVLRIGRRDI